VDAGTGANTPWIIITPHHRGKIKIAPMIAEDHPKSPKVQTGRPGPLEHPPSAHHPSASHTDAESS